jgi:hypothetical protein
VGGAPGQNQEPEEGSQRDGLKVELVGLTLSTQLQQMLEHLGTIQFVKAVLGSVAGSGQKLLHTAPITIASPGGQARGDDQVLMIFLDQLVEATREVWGFHSPPESAEDPRGNHFIMWTWRA